MLTKRNTYSITQTSVDSKSAEQLEIPFAPSSIKSRLRNYEIYLGIFYTFLCSMFLTLQSVFVKKLPYMNPVQLALVRSIGLLVGCFPISIYSAKEVLGQKKDIKLMVVRGLLSATSMLLFMIAYRYLPLAEAAIILSTVPATTILLARIFLKERCGLVQGFALVISLLGVLLSIRLPEHLSTRHSTNVDFAYIGGLAAAVFCVFAMSASFIAMRRLKHAPFSVSVMYYGFVGVIFYSTINVSAFEFALPHCGLDQVLVILMGIFSFLGTATLTLACQTELVGIVSVMKSSLDVIIAIIFQIMLFSVYPDIYNVSGAFLIIISVTMIGFNKWLNSLPEESETRNRFKYLSL